MDVLIGGQNLPVRITRKKMKNITLRVSKEGEIRISCPWYAPEEDIRRLIYSNEAWILEQRLRRQKENEINREGVSGPAVYWLGDRKTVRYVPAKKDCVFIEGDSLTFFLKEESEERIEKAFRRAANQTILSLAEEARKEWDEKICRENGLPLPEISLRYMTGKWGVCYPQRSKIVLSTRLIHYPSECLEYVLLHEYVHFLVPNHSRKFYDMVRSYMPDYAFWKKLLK